MLSGNIELAWKTEKTRITNFDIFLAMFINYM